MVMTTVGCMLLEKSQPTQVMDSYEFGWEWCDLDSSVAVPSLKICPFCVLFLYQQGSLSVDYRIFCLARLILSVRLARGRVICNSSYA